MNEEFIVECLTCSKFSLHSLESVRSMTKGKLRIGIASSMEGILGNIDCPHCKSIVHLQLAKCNKCDSGWANFHEKPNKTMRSAYGERITMWIATRCPSCYPKAREEVIKYGEIRS